MLDWIRERLKDADTKREERVTAYLDGRLSAEQNRQFEAQLAEDDSLSAEVAALQAVKQQLTTLPTVRAPRNYTLDPATYGAPAAAYGARLYPAVRFATAMAAFMFIFMVTLTLLSGGEMTQQTAMSEPQPVAVEVANGELETTAEQVNAYDDEGADAADEDGASTFSGAALEDADTAEEEMMGESVIDVPEASDAEAESAVVDEADDGAAANAMVDETQSADSVESDDPSARTLRPTPQSQAESAPVPPVVAAPTEVARSVQSTSTVALPDVVTEQTTEAEMDETVVSADAPSTGTQSLLIPSFVLLIVLFSLMLWLRTKARRY